MSAIHSVIIAKKADFIKRTGIIPTRIYLGDEEITALLQWAYESQYIASKPEDADIEGKNRPEVDGLLTYVVNDKNHIEFS